MPAGQLEGSNDVREGTDKITSGVNIFHKVAIIIAANISICTSYLRPGVSAFYKPATSFINSRGGNRSGLEPRTKCFYQ